MTVSGLYQREQLDDVPFTNESIRLDVDGDFPQQAVSGTGTSGLVFRTHWIAQPLTPGIDPNNPEWSGPIVHKFGNASLLPHNSVVVRTAGTSIEVTFKGPGLPDRVRTYSLQSHRFHDVRLEYDAEQGVDLQLEYETHSHPDRPATLANETLSIDVVYERAGFNVIRTGEDSVVPSSLSGTNNQWADSEMHDAMQTHFSILASLPPSERNRARWALWTFFAGQHERGSSLGGIMFDSIGSAKRQGTALFIDSFIADAPATDPQPEAWRRRMAFWTAVHEMGHAFNLLHAWDKSFRPWIPTHGGFDLMTFMNYPYLFETGSQSDANTVRFFRQFGFRFTDDELLFLRHAPEDFVIMGGADFAENHAFEQARLSPSPALKFEVRVNRPSPVFEFMEPVVIEFKLTNTSKQPVLLPEHLLQMSDRLTVQVTRPGNESRVFHPFAHACIAPSLKVLAPGESMYESLFVSVDHEDWLISSPGYYVIQACLHMPDEDIVSEPFRIRVVPPSGRDEEYIAQDYFTEDVGRVLTFDGTQYLTYANDTLKEVVARLPDAKVSTHAQIALCLPRAVPYKQLQISGTQRGSRYKIVEKSATKTDLAMITKLLGDAKQADAVAETLGHIDYHYYADRCAFALEVDGHDSDALNVQSCLFSTLESRNVAKSVLAGIEASLPQKPASRNTRSRRRGKQ